MLECPRIGQNYQSFLPFFILLQTIIFRAGKLILGATYREN
jgi:hypothetical protein